MGCIELCEVLHTATVTPTRIPIGFSVNLVVSGSLCQSIGVRQCKRTITFIACSVYYRPQTKFGAR